MDSNLETARLFARPVLRDIGLATARPYANPKAGQFVIPLEIIFVASREAVYHPLCQLCHAGFLRPVQEAHRKRQEANQGKLDPDRCNCGKGFPLDLDSKINLE
ncbi:hypothetical protein AGR3A_Cc120034 [Agrobacterium tomkonis CFBP 6623]|uniref:Uncharacterized protein n=1 Tax=Agrobacterium tomkonis CFBP 6623 TaxID=1183432 RepID=A0A1S7NMG5_9HYPH|nr:hypothetical protein AGR3A_Cc120034 [Agrobacterium tomkonis CFBP 6623]